MLHAKTIPNIILNYSLYLFSLFISVSLQQDMGFLFMVSAIKAEGIEYVYDNYILYLLTQIPIIGMIFHLIYGTIVYMYSMMTVEQKLCLLSLFISHGAAFIVNYLMKGEYKKATIGKLMGQPYARVVIMHVAICLGGLASEKYSSPLFMLCILILLKTIIDSKMYFRERKRTFGRGSVIP